MRAAWLSGRSWRGQLPQPNPADCRIALLTLSRVIGCRSLRNRTDDGVMWIRQLDRYAPRHCISRAASIVATESSGRAVGRRLALQSITRAARFVCTLPNAETFCDVSLAH
jgi:hypothetical protein